MMVRETWATLDLNALHHNFHHLESITQTQVFGVVKANAYGHDALIMSKAFIEMGSPYLCVSSIDEALELYEKGIRHDILIFSYTDPKHIKAHHRDNFVYTVSSYDWFENMDANSTLRVHLEINTGMNRTGIKPTSKLQSILDSSLMIEGIYTHFQSPDHLEAGEKQIQALIQTIQDYQIQVPWVHVGNAPTSIIKKYASIINGSRFGLGLYGYRVDVPELKPVLALYSKICHVDQLKQGETLGYDYTYTAEADGIVFGSFPLGYADGFDMRQNSVAVWIKDGYHPIIGKICMDQTMVKLPDASYLHETVELIGPHRPLTTLSQETGISIYVLLSLLSKRVHRVILK